MIIAGLIDEAVPSPIDLRRCIKLAKFVNPDSAMPPWLELSISDTIIPATFEEPFQKYGHDADVVEKLIWKIWHGKKRAAPALPTLITFVQ
jgi:hypothetical protein